MDQVLNNNPLEVRFSFFPAPVTNKKPSRVMTLKDAFGYITGMEARERTQALRQISGKKEARAYKGTHFDYVTFSGEFSYGADDKLIRHSGLLCLDFDLVTDVAQVKEMLLDDDYFETQLLFTSPSGDGVKWVVAIDLSQCDHRTWFRALANYVRTSYGLVADPSGINVSRACFLPHDALVYVNPDVCPF